MTDELRVPAVSTVTDWLNGKVAPKPVDLVQLADKFKYSIDWILSGVGPDGNTSTSPIKRGVWRTAPQIETDLASLIRNHLLEEGYSVADKLEISPSGILSSLKDDAITRIKEWQRTERLALARLYAERGYLTAAAGRAGRLIDTYHLLYTAPSQGTNPYELFLLTMYWIAAVMEQAVDNSSNAEREDSWFALSGGATLADTRALMTNDTTRSDVQVRLKRALIGELPDEAPGGWPDGGWPTVP